MAGLTARTAAHAQLVVRPDGSPAPWSLDDLVEVVRTAPPGDLVVLAGAEGMQVVPVRRAAR